MAARREHQSTHAHARCHMRGGLDCDGGPREARVRRRAKRTPRAEDRLLYGDVTVDRGEGGGGVLLHLRGATLEELDKRLDATGRDDRLLAGLVARGQKVQPLGRGGLRWRVALREDVDEGRHGAGNEEGLGVLRVVLLCQVAQPGRRHLHRLLATRGGMLDSLGQQRLETALAGDIVGGDAGHVLLLPHGEESLRACYERDAAPSTAHTAHQESPDQARQRAGGGVD